MQETSTKHADTFMYYNDPAVILGTIIGEAIGIHLMLRFWIGCFTLPTCFLIIAFRAWRQDELRRKLEATIGHPIHPRTLVKRLPYAMESKSGRISYGIPTSTQQGRINPKDLHCFLHFDQWSIAASQPEHVSAVAHHLRKHLGYNIPLHPVEEGKVSPVTSEDLKPYLPKGVTVAYPKELVWSLPAPSRTA